MRLVLPFLLLAAACAEPVTEGDLTEVEVAADDDGKADADSEVKVRLGETSIWMSRDLTRREDSANGPVFVLRGRASRNITDGNGFVMDDPYGDFATRGARSFEVTWPVSVGRTLVDGVDQFLALHFAPSPSRPDSLTTRVVVRPRLGNFTGASSIYLTAELTPVVLGGVVVYRARGRTTSAMTGLAVVANGQSLTDVRRPDSTHFEIDLAPEVAFALTEAGNPDATLAITAQLASGQAATKFARLGLAIKKLGVTTGDAYEEWPRPECPAATKTCLVNLPAGAVDLGSCGEAFVVLSCAGRVGVFVDDVTIQAAIADGAARTSAASFRSDAVGLVGADRLEAFAGGAQQTIEYRVEQQIGRWYLSAATRTAAVTGTVDRALHDVYARPLDLVEPIAPVAGNLAVIRQVAADALLARLATFDFVDTAYGRTYDELVAQFRTQHVASIRAFRETLELEDYSGHPEWQVLTGRWLDAYTEVAIIRATGAAASAYIEVD